MQAEILEAIKGIETIEDVKAYALKEGQEITDEEAKKSLAFVTELKQKGDSLTDEELESIAGGWGWHDIYDELIMTPVIIGNSICDHFEPNLKPGFKPCCLFCVNLYHALLFLFKCSESERPNFRGI